MKRTWGVLVTSTLLTAVVISGLHFTNQTYAESGSKIADKAADQLSSSTVDYIKTVDESGRVEEHWRDTKTLQERHDIYDKDGTLINRIIVTDEGKTVISISNEDGKLKADKWTVPSEVAEENKKLLNKSLIKEFKDELNNKEWKKKGEEKLQGKEVQKLEAVYKIESESKDKHKEVVFVDQETNYPKKREIYAPDKNGKVKLQRTEFFEFYEGDTSDLFDVDDKIKIKKVDSDIKEKEFKKAKG